MELVKWTERIRNKAVIERVSEERIMLKLMSRLRDFGPDTIIPHPLYVLPLYSVRRYADFPLNCSIGSEVSKPADEEEKKELVESLAKKKLPSEACTGRNGEREKICCQKNLKVRIYKTVILPVVLYGCETWTLTLREEHRLRVFENKVLRKIFGAKRDEVTGEWRKLHNTELHALYSSPDIIRNIKSRRLRWAGHVARMGESRNAYSVLVGRAEGTRPLGRPRCRWEDNIKMDLREVGYDDREWINLAQDRDQWRAYVRVAMNLRVPRRALYGHPGGARRRGRPRLRRLQDVEDGIRKIGIKRWRRVAHDRTEWLEMG
ncbi:hypothetical protein ANN_02536 [Periplaneta americana]|uniref:Uncharacterized protein n=1 Tax=Periplaneta americana TaxID=6978 RepID=A0ABQ8TZI7_PERAM|nr:hypothetical protein ANN_02536 [Periplaneta americana]